jgi:3-dehydroquinate dehydratase I
VTARICISILPKNSSQAIDLIRKAEEAKANFIEIRLDCLNESASLKEIAESTKIPLIATNKLESENGYFYGSEIERDQTLINAAKNGFKYIDIDFYHKKRVNMITELTALDAKLVVSYHNYEKIVSVSTMEKILDEQISLGAEICKIVLTANQLEDNLPILSFISFASAKAKLVCFCMGEQGKISRLLAPVFGAFFTFASLEPGSQTAKGQMTISEMKTAYNLLGIKP